MGNLNQKQEKVKYGTCKACIVNAAMQMLTQTYSMIPVTIQCRSTDCKDLSVQTYLSKLFCNIIVNKLT